jgi:ferric-dicitrate binding protein FerR (iron transport regulator)
VLEGRVQVYASANAPARTVSASPAPALVQLDAGQTADVTHDGRISRQNAPDIGQVAAWRERRLIFRNDPLVDIVQEFNRYNEAPRFRVADKTISQRRYSGIFDAYDPRSLMQVLSSDGDLAVHEVDEEILIGPRRR